MDKEYDMWKFLYRELSKIQVISECYDKLFKIIDVKNNRYNHIMQLILDSFTKTIFIDVTKFFDKSNNAWSLYRFKCLQQKEIDLAKDKAKEFIVDRHTKYAHLSKNIIHKNNFNFLSENGIKKVYELISCIDNLLKEVSNRNKYNEGYALTWLYVDSSLDCLIEDLEK